MKTGKKVFITIDLIVEMLKQFDDEVKEEIFERVYLEEDTSPLTDKEKHALEITKRELKNQETVKWPFGG